MTKKIVVSEIFMQNVLRLRYGSTQPASDALPLFSLTCICRYLKAPLSSVRKVVCSFFIWSSIILKIDLNNLFWFLILTLIYDSKNMVWKKNFTSQKKFANIKVDKFHYQNDLRFKLFNFVWKMQNYICKFVLRFSQNFHHFSSLLAKFHYWPQKTDEKKFWKFTRIWKSVATWWKFFFIIIFSYPALVKFWTIFS